MKTFNLVTLIFFAMIMFTGCDPTEQIYNHAQRFDFQKFNPRVLEKAEKMFETEPSFSVDDKKKFFCLNVKYTIDGGEKTEWLNGVKNIFMTRQ